MTLLIFIELSVFRFEIEAFVYFADFSGALAWKTPPQMKLLPFQTENARRSWLSKALKMFCGCIFHTCSKDQAEEDSEAVLFKSVRSKLYEGLAESKLTPAANVRKRRRAKLGNELDDAEVDAMIQDLNLDEDAPAPAPITVSDPIKWFGVLVPQSLKQAQACFTKGQLSE